MMMISFLNTLCVEVEFGDRLGIFLKLKIF